MHATGPVKPGDPDAKIKFLAAEALRRVGGLVFDALGNRFANELGRRDYVTGEVEEQTSFPSRSEQGCFRRNCLALQALVLQALKASPPTGARGNPARGDGATGHDNSAGAKDVMSVQYARVDGVLRGGAPPPVRRDARGQREQPRRAKPVVRTASD